MWYTACVASSVDLDAIVAFKVFVHLKQYAYVQEVRLLISGRPTSSHPSIEVRDVGKAEAEAELMMKREGKTTESHVEGEARQRQNV